jgi:hypothetical protein
MHTEENTPLAARSAGRDGNSRPRLVVPPWAPRRHFESRPVPPPHTDTKFMVPRKSIFPTSTPLWRRIA